MNKKLMLQAGFDKEIAEVELGNCPFCKKPVKEADFTDFMSVKEFGISGLCQVCQDQMFE